MKIPVFLFACLFLYNQASAFDLPLPDQTTREGEQDINYNNTPYKGEIYRSRLSEAEVSAFYKNALAGGGFSLITEEKTPHTLHFVNFTSKEHIFILLDSSMEDEVQISVSFWQGDLTVAQESPFEITSDAPGGDIPGVPRYPGAIRISATNNGEMQNACYSTTDNTESVISFYEGRMPASGWKALPESEAIRQRMNYLSSPGDQGPESKYGFYQKKGRLLVVIASGQCCGSKKNLISVLLTQEKVLGED